jgi:hypothetical protein
MFLEPEGFRSPECAVPAVFDKTLDELSSEAITMEAKHRITPSRRRGSVSLLTALSGPSSISTYAACLLCAVVSARRLSAFRAIVSGHGEQKYVKVYRYCGITLLVQEKPLGRSS